MYLRKKQTSLDQYLIFKPKLTTSSIENDSQPSRFHRNINRIIPFVKDVEILTHPLFLASSNIKTKMHKCANGARGLTEHLCQNKFKPLGQFKNSGLVLHGSSRELFATAVAHDDLSGMIAVGFMSGHIQFYRAPKWRRLSMCQQQHEAELKPFRSFDTKQAIRSLTWIWEDCRLNLFVAFNYSGTILIYEIIMNPNDCEISYQSLSRGPMFKMLEANGLSKESGYRCIMPAKVVRKITLPHSKTLNQKRGLFSRTTQSDNSVLSTKVMNTSETETVVDNFLIAGTTSGYVRCWKLGSQKQQWCVKMDPQRPVSHTYEVIGLWMINEHQFLATSNDGSFTCWDLTRSAPSTFGCGSKDPYCCEIFNISSKLISTVKGNEIKRKILDVEPYSYNNKHEVKVLVEDGSIYVVNVFGKSVVSVNPDRFKPLFDNIESSFDPGNMDVRGVYNHRSMISFDIVPGWTGIVSNNVLYGGIARERYFLFDENKYRCTSTSSVTGKYESALFKTLNCNYVLPGYVQSANPGDFVIFLSHDLNEYLVSNKLCDNMLNKSSRIEFEYFLHQQRFVVSAQVASVRGCEVTLTEEYCGPLIESSNPLVRIRTNLRCGSIFQESNPCDKSIAKPPSAVCNCSMPVTSFSLSSLQLIIVGNVDGSLSFFGFGSTDLDEVPECAESENSGLNFNLNITNKVFGLFAGISCC